MILFWIMYMYRAEKVHISSSFKSAIWRLNIGHWATRHVYSSVAGRLTVTTLFNNTMQLRCRNCCFWAEVALMELNLLSIEDFLTQ